MPPRPAIYVFLWGRQKLVASKICQKAPRSGSLPPEVVHLAHQNEEWHVIFVDQNSSACDVTVDRAVNAARIQVQNQLWGNTLQFLHVSKDTGDMRYTH